MPRHKNSTRNLHVRIDSAAFDALHAECKRLTIRPGQFLSRLITERAATFFSHHVQLSK
jgi:hypothetical protein